MRRILTALCVLAITPAPFACPKTDAEAAIAVALATGPVAADDCPDCPEAELLGRLGKVESALEVIDGRLAEIEKKLTTLATAKPGCECGPDCECPFGPYCPGPDACPKQDPAKTDRMTPPKPAGEGWLYDASLCERNPAATGWYRPVTVAAPVVSAAPAPVPVRVVRPAAFAPALSAGPTCVNGRCYR